MLGETIKAARESQGLIQEQLAAKLKTDVSRVSRWERGTENMNLKRTRDAARVLKIPRERLIAAVLQTVLERAEIDYTVNVQARKAKSVNAGLQLKKLRLKQDVSVSELARRLGVARSRVHELETGLTGLKPHTAWWYADALEVDHKEPVRLALQDSVNRYCSGDFTVTLR